MAQPIAFSKDKDISQDDYETWKVYLENNDVVQRLADLHFDIMIKPGCVSSECIASKLAVAQLWSQKVMGFTSPTFMGFKHMLQWLDAYEKLMEKTDES